MKEKENSTEKRPLFLEQLTVRFDSGLRGFAARLQRETIRYSARKKKVFLLLFCLAFATQSAWVAYTGFQKDTAPAVSVTPMRFVPLLKEERAFSSSLKEFQRVHRFKRYVDSLGTTPSGQAIRDSLLCRRPHLMDTVIYLESIYNQEHKNDTHGKEEPKN